MRRAPAAAAAAVLACGVFAATASAATKTVDMGLPLSAQKAFQAKNVDVNDFFPHGTTIHVGDSIRFVPTGFHTVDLPPRGNGPVALVAPTGTLVSGADDAAGQPFWFNGQPNLSFNPVLFASSFGKHVAYRGTARIDSGLPIAAHPKPMVVKFTKAGTFTFLCDVHAGMKGVVHVVGRTHKVPSAKADARALKQQLTHASHEASSTASIKPPSGVIYVGGAGSGGVENYAFFPSNPTYPVGTTVTFRMSPGSLEEHTATTGPGDPETEPSSYLGQLSASLQSPQFNPAAAYPSDTPSGAPANLTPTYHGNGFWNAGVLDNSSATPLPNSNSVRFAAPGTYVFHCLIHPFMKATITIQ